jgi:LEA14-like dessication related protein
VKRGLLAALVATAFVLSSHAAGLPKPSAELKSFRLESISLKEAVFLFEVAVKNPYPVGLSFDGMSLSFSVEGKHVLDLASKGGFSVPARGTKSQSFTASLDYAGIAKAIGDYASKEWLTTRIDGKLVIPIPKVPGMVGLPPNVSFDYKLEKQIPALKPRVSIVDFKVEAPSTASVTAALAKAGKKTDPAKATAAFKDVLAGRKPSVAAFDPADIDLPLAVSFTIELANDAKGKLEFDKLGYELSINGEKLVVGDSSKILREGGRTLLEVRSQFSSKKLSAGVRKVFSDKGGAFSVKGSASLKVPAEIREGPLPLAFEEGGRFSLK